MKRAFLSSIVISAIVTGILVGFSNKAAAVGTLITVSSFTYDAGVTREDEANGVTVDNAGNIIVAGFSHNGATYDWLTIK